MWLRVCDYTRVRYPRIALRWCSYSHVLFRRKGDYSSPTSRSSERDVFLHFYLRRKNRVSDPSVFLLVENSQMSTAHLCFYFSCKNQYFKPEFWGFLWRRCKTMSVFQTKVQEQVHVSLTCESSPVHIHRCFLHLIPVWTHNHLSSSFPNNVCRCQ